MISAGLLIAAPPHTKRPRSSGQTSLLRCYQPERPFCTLARYPPPIRTAPFTYMCLSAQVRGWRRGTRVHAGNWHAWGTLRGVCVPLHRAIVCQQILVWHSSCWIRLRKHALSHKYGGSNSNDDDDAVFTVPSSNIFTTRIRSDGHLDTCPHRVLIVFVTL